MGYTLAELADLVQGKVIGDERATITAVLPNNCADQNAIAFLSPDKNPSEARKCNAGALLVRNGFGPAPMPTIEVADPRRAALTIAALFRPPVPKPSPGIHALASVDPTAKIGVDCHIGPFAVVEAGVTIGDRTIIHAHAVVRAACVIGADVEVHPQAVLYPNTILGDRVIVHAGVVLGCDGFGYELTGDGHTKVPQLGNLEIAEDVEIGANSTIDRATIGSTTIGAGTKLDNLVMIGHNCRLGKHNAVASQAGLAGSCKTGDYVFMGGKAGLADHITIGDGAVLLASVGVQRDVEQGERLAGTPARPAREWAEQFVATAKLPKLLREFERLRKDVERLRAERECA